MEMRYYVSLKGASLTSFSYTWDIAYARILSTSAFESLVNAVSTTDLGITYGDYASTTHEYIFPKILAKTLVLSGVGMGNLKMSLILWCSSGYTVIGSIYAVVSICARDSVGADRILSTYTTNTFSAAQTTSSTEHVCDYPISLTFSNAKVLSSERVVMKIVYYAKYTHNHQYPSEFAGQNAKAYHAINTNNVMVELSIAGS